MDNLRVAVITGVIVLHVATAYVLDISWYYEERTASGVTEALLAVLFLPTALFAMAVLFPGRGECSRRVRWPAKAPKASGGSRLLRLGVPVVVFIVVVDPATSVLGSWGSGDYADFADDGPLRVHPSWQRADVVCRRAARLLGDVRGGGGGSARCRQTPIGCCGGVIS